MKLSNLDKTLNKIQSKYFIEFGQQLYLPRIKFVIDAFLNEIKEVVANKSSYAIRNFGKFTTKYYKGRTTRNPLSQGVVIEDHDVPTFVAAPEFKKELRYKSDLDQDNK